MLAGILFLTLIIAVGALITVDVLRSPTDTSAGPSDRQLRDAQRPLAAARAGTGVHAFTREPAVSDQPLATQTARAAAPAQVGAFERPDATTRGFDPIRPDVPSVPTDAQRGKLNTTFVNLSRRSQALVERQLRLIESLEHGEQDQQRLASLARLNRIAMHVHRNSQNLLVLVGQEPTTSWNQPVTLAQLVEAALGEVEDYERVSFDVQPDIAVRGPAVHDAVHVLVELIDNATAFSAADMPVQIRGQVLTSGGALIDITDGGIGMAAKEMAYANQQLDNPPPPDIDVPKWMGLLVVARLAARHGIRVRLNQAEFGGLTALVWLPDEILTYHAVDPGYAAAQRGPAAYPAGRVNSQDMAPTRADPAWSARGPQGMAEPTTAGRLSAASRPDLPGSDVGVVIPRAERQTQVHGLPIFDGVESRWPRGAHEAPGTVGLAAASGPPAGANVPRRPAAVTQAQRTVHPLPPGAPPNSGRQDES